MKLLFEVPNAAFFDCGGGRLMLGLCEQPEFDRGASTIYYKVPNIRATFETFSSRGVRFESEPHFVTRMPATTCGWRSSETQRSTCWH